MNSTTNGRYSNLPRIPFPNPRNVADFREAVLRTADMIREDVPLGEMELLKLARLTLSVIGRREASR